jgi:putative nucleotidyltransferase with HDIG domain
MFISRSATKALVVDDVSRAAQVVATILSSSRGFDVQAVNDPLEALEIVRSQPPDRPFDLVLMDYQMPGMDGIELLSKLKQADASTTYVMMTGRNDLKVVISALKAGVQGFVIKPFNRSELLEAVDMALQKTRLVREHLQMKVYGPMLEGAIGALLSALEYEHSDTANHSRKVSDLAKDMALEFQMSHDELSIVRLGALFHDIGKIGVPDHILLKPGPLTPEERKEMMKHPEIGERIIKDVEGLGHVAKIVRAHHERFDGKGYPDGLKGEQIPLGARIAAVADSFEAMIARRVYSNGRPVEDALEEVHRCSGKHFDPDVVNVFLRKMSVNINTYEIPTQPLNNLNYCFQLTPD